VLDLPKASGNLSKTNKFLSITQAFECEPPHFWDSPGDRDNPGEIGGAVCPRRSPSAGLALSGTRDLRQYLIPVLPLFPRPHPPALF
jgi:hypothetical protein